jgi:hypothetical protein
VDAALKMAKTFNNRITLFAAALSWVLLAYAEPRLGIWLTNKTETQKYKHLHNNAAQAVIH